MSFWEREKERVINQVIVVRDPVLSEADIDKAFAGNSGAPWYKALVQIIDDTRRDNILEASRAASSGNTHAMAGGLNVYEAFSGLLLELDKKVNATSLE